MKCINTLATIAAALITGHSLTAAPLRVLVASDNQAFAESYSAAMEKAGAQVITATDPDESKLSHTDVLLLHRSKFESLTGSAQEAITAFTKRGGGIVAVKAAIAAGDKEWGLANIGGAWDPKDSRTFNSLMMLYVVSNSHPIVNDASPFDIQDDTLYDLTLSDDAFVLASAFTPKGRDAKRGGGPKVPGRDVRASIYDIQPQMWTFETPGHRAAVFLQGDPTTLAHASMRTFILRAVAWAGKRENTDELCDPTLLANLRYPAGGPLRAADAIKQFEMQPGFVATVVAEEPLINKPIAIQWDGKDRMWVAETPEYPNGKRPLVAPAWKETGVLDPGNYDRPGRDRISILSDTDGDGKMDKKDIFYQGLELVTGFCLHENGAIAVAQPNIVSLQDKDGDGKAELITPLFGGFAPGDTHFVANHFINAPDGWIYASTGSGARATHPETNQEMARISPGVFRFKADGSAIEQVASQGGNSFGGEVTSDMELFHGKATSGQPIQHIVLPEWVLAHAPGTKARSMASVNPGRTIARNDMPDRAPLMQIDQVGRYSAACSTLVYEGGAWPKQYDGKVFVTEPILDIIHHEEMTPNGATLKGELVLENQEWLRSKDYWFCPIDVAIGPDGAMYVLDFYTPVVTHNDTRGPQHSKSGASVRPDRDQYFGRIYRIQHNSAPNWSATDLTTADAATLVTAFKHPNRVVRFNARRILSEKADTLGKQAMPALTAMATTEPFAPARILALWSLHHLEQLSEKTLNSAFQSPDPAIRKNAMLIAESAGIPLTGPQASAGISDKDGRVRLATLRALGASAMTPDASAALLAESARLKDPWSKAAAAAAGSRNPSSQLETILTDSSKSDQSEESVRSLAASLASGGNARRLLGILRAAATSPNPQLAAAVLDEISKAAPAAPRNPAAALSALRPILKSSDRRLASSALPLAASWDKNAVLSDEISAVAGSLLTVARDPKQPDAPRIEAIRVLLPARAANKFILPNVISLLETPNSDAFATELITALSATGEPAAGTAFIEAFPTLPAGQQETAFNALLSRPEWARLILAYVEAGKIAPEALTPARISRLTAHPDAGVAKAAKAIFNSTDNGKDKIIADLLPQMEAPSDLANGKLLFTAVCSMCHQLDGAGHHFGADLGGICSHPVLELLTHIVNPNLVVDDEHRTWNITMKDGTQYSALIASENKARVQIRQPAGITTDLKAADITKRVKGDNSLMPEGLENIGTENLRDIIAYIRSCAPANEIEPSK